MMTRAEAMAKIVAENPHFALEEIEVRGIPWRVYKNAPNSLRAVLESTRQYADLPFLAYEDERWTFADNLRIASGLAKRWQEFGISKGDRVAVSMRNYPEWVMAFWATQSLGAIIVPLNAWWTTDELAYAIQDSTPKILIVDAERLGRVAGKLNDLGVQETIAVRVVGDVPAGVRRWEAELAELDPPRGTPTAFAGSGPKDRSKSAARGGGHQGRPAHRGRP